MLIASHVVDKLCSRLYILRKYMQVANREQSGVGLLRVHMHGLD
jgi:hypothetical protein